MKPNRKHVVKSAIVSLSLLTAIGVGMISTPAYADVYNPNVSVGKSELRAKCKRAGGTFVVEKNGTYRCTVDNGDSQTVVECEVENNCDGYIFDTPRKAVWTSKFVLKAFPVQSFQLAR